MASIIGHKCIEVQLGLKSAKVWSIYAGGTSFFFEMGASDDDDTGKPFLLKNSFTRSVCKEDKYRVRVCTSNHIAPSQDFRQIFSLGQYFSRTDQVVPVVLLVPGTT